ncbi:uncharacterized protein EAF02_004621 [Botrytis sinoallii]|uniref:uncharacterized protein n=1 Tax=Botrytis sinoallii TaxID=1463999 RepID=UPI0018FFECE7|nr:uncharacterized protein EAF02_004621 [Botrytis sinoallii]KAF7884285.1 hypothetical protein EAF02_004621 [Botrytis sinoallii]
MDNLIKYKSCHTPNFTPHYYNLDLPVSATQEDIEQAHRRLLQLVHPDNLRGPEQNSSAETATQLINEAYEVLRDDEKRFYHLMVCEKTFGCRFKSDYRQRFGVDFWNSRWASKHREIDSFAPKPWPWDYDTLSTEIMCPPEKNDGFQFCTATWVNAAHILVDNLLPYSVSDNIWRRVETWRSGNPGNETVKDVYLDFQRGCDNFKVLVEKREPYIPWSQIPANTDWPTLGKRCSLFCVDILTVPFSIFSIILILLILVSFQTTKKPKRKRRRPVFRAPSARSSRASTYRTIDGDVARSQNQARTRASQRPNSFYSSDGDYYADEDSTSLYRLGKPQKYSVKEVSSRYTNPSDKSESTRYPSTITKQSRATSSTTDNLTTNPPPIQHKRLKVPQSRSPSTSPNSSSSTSLSSSTSSSNPKPQRPPSPTNASQFFSLNPSEKHYYYPNNDLPLRERRNTSTTFPPTRQRYVHYEDEKDWADDERTPRLCMALTATGKQCSRRVSLVTPLSGSTVEALVSPLCYQHRHVRKWVRAAHERGPPVEESVSSVERDRLPEEESRRPSVRFLDDDEEDDEY